MDSFHYCLKYFSHFYFFIQFLYYHCKLFFPFKNRLKVLYSVLCVNVKLQLCRAALCLRCVFIVFRPVHCGSLTVVPLLRYNPRFIFCVGDVKIINKGTLICVSNIGEKIQYCCLCTIFKKRKVLNGKIKLWDNKKNIKNLFRPLKSFKCNYNTLAYMYNVDNRVIIRYHQQLPEVFDNRSP